MDHGQFQMRQRVVHRHACRLGLQQHQQHDHRRQRQPDEGRAAVQLPDQRGKAAATARHHGAADQQEQRGLDEAGERCLACCAHALKRTADVECREHQEQACQTQCVSEENKIVAELQRCHRTQNGRDHGRQQAGRQHDPGTGPKQRCCHCAVNRLLVQQALQIPKRLQQAWPLAPGPQRFAAIHQAEHQDRHRERKQHVRDG